MLCCFVSYTLIGCGERVVPKSQTNHMINICLFNDLLKAPSRHVLWLIDCLKQRSVEWETKLPIGQAANAPGKHTSTTFTISHKAHWPMCPFNGQTGTLTASVPLPHPLTLTHTPPVMFTGLRKESINSDLVAVSCGPLCKVVTFGE